MQTHIQDKTFASSFQAAARAAAQPYTGILPAEGQRECEGNKVK